MQIIRQPPFDIPWQTPERITVAGQFVALAPLNPHQDVADLYHASHEPVEHQAIWTYLPNGPFTDQAAMLEWLLSIATIPDPLFFTATLLETGRKIGMISIMSIVPTAGRAELGHIWYSPTVHKTPVNTEATYLLLRYLFEELSYRRVEWKCNNENVPSKRAALRMGFLYEGLFRQHLIVKGKNRDTAWFSLLDSEWESRKTHFEQWLYSGEKFSLAERNAVFHRGKTRADGEIGESNTPN